LDQCGESYSLANATNPITAGITCPEETPKCYGRVSNNYGVCVHSRFKDSGECAYNNKDKEWINENAGYVPEMCPKTAPKCVGYAHGTDWGHCTHSNFNDKNECAYDYQDKAWRDIYPKEVPFMCPISKPNCSGWKPGTWGQCGLYPDQ